MGEKNELKNRYMHIRRDKTTHSNEKRHIEQHIADENSISVVLDTKEISSKMKDNIKKLYDAFGKMYSLELTEKITGAGKGRYRFIV